jgi:hypothetical protein
MRFQVFMPVVIQVTAFLNVLSCNFQMNKFSEKPNASICRAENEDSSFLQNNGISYRPSQLRTG